MIGYLSGGSPGHYAPYVAAFRQGLIETGYIEGRNVAIEYRWAEGRYEQLPAFAAELVGRNVDVIAAGGSDLATIAAKGVTSTIPIVFTTGGDPVNRGLVASLARPGGNVTGGSFLTTELNQKRLDLIVEAAPRAAAIALLVNPKSGHTERVVREVHEAAHAKGLRLEVVRASSENEIDAGFDALLKHQAGALLVAPEPFIDSRRDQIVGLAARYAIPAIYSYREFVLAGGLLSYGVSLADVYHQLGLYTGAVLKGAKPADLPVIQPTRFGLGINLKTAEALGLTVPQSLLALADEVIE